MKFDLISDMHVDLNHSWFSNPNYDYFGYYYPFHHEIASDILVIAGDCANDPRITKKVIEEASKTYKQVLFVDGNHEHYIGYKRSSRFATVNTNMRFLDNLNIANVHYLKPYSPFIIGDTAFIGCNGWYDFKSYMMASREQQHQYWKQDSNDSACIRFDPNNYPDKMAEKHAKYLAEQVELYQTNDTVKNIVVVTHTIPNKKGTYPDQHNDGYLNGAYHCTAMNDVVMKDINNKIKVWCYGHTHVCNDFVDNGIRYVNNSRGYAMQKKTDFKGVIQINTDENLKSAFELMEYT